MAWLVGIAIVVLVIFFLSKGSRNSPSIVHQHTRSVQERAKFLPEGEREKLSAEVRELALEQYDMASAKAKEVGKDDTFAHQVGVLRAVSAVIVMGEQVDSYRERELQMETVPFNKLVPSEGRNAVAEYLVYKFFPDKADENAFSPALVSFKQQMLAESENHPDPFAFMVDMIYIEKCDWQRYITALPKAGG